jgi:exodeoxyribonuclease-5
MSFELNPQQNTATKEAKKWWDSHTNQTFEISGPAGSGKTTIVYELIKNIGLKHDEVLFMAYVGKATMALALKGNFAKTIHSSIYNLVDVPKLDENGIPLQKNGRILTTATFAKKESLPKNIKLLVIDEGSMVDHRIAKDVLSYGLPVLVLGDLDQLPPVFGKSYFLQNPDVILTQIMRQNENNPIIWLSQRAKKGLRIDYGKYGDMCYVIPKDQIDDNLLKNSDIIICGKNETRQNINTYYRETIQGVKQKVPVYGDKIVCRQNNWKLSVDENIFLINGLIGYVEDIYLDTYNGKSICIDFRPEFMEDKVFHKIPIDFEYLFQSVTEKSGGRLSFWNKFQFARAITCHLSQGSQYGKVLVYRERIGSWDYQKKWDYTAFTRAIHGLVIAM